MATLHSTSKIRSGRNSPLKNPAIQPKSASRSKTPINRRNTKPVQARPHVKGSTTPGRPGSEIAERGSRIRVRGRLRDMIQAELRNLGRVESILRCLALSMEYESLDPESPYYPDVVEVAGDLIKRSLVDLDVLYDGYIPNPLLAARPTSR